MSGSVIDLLEPWRRPEYTGENRCMPCTTVNTVIAIVLAIFVGIVVPLNALYSVTVGGLVLALSILAIALRGYLVPGTPSLTKTYFPDWVLRYFDHDEPMVETDIEPVEVLEAADAVTECENLDDLCLTDEFRESWQTNIKQLRDSDTLRTDLADVLDLTDQELDFQSRGSAFVAVANGDQTAEEHHPRRQRVGQWESEGAFIADLAGARVLKNQYPDWNRLTPPARGQVLNGLRIFLDRCPTCDGPVTFGEETVESCCRSKEVVAVTCTDCKSRLFEAEAPRSS